MTGITIHNRKQTKRKNKKIQVPIGSGSKKNMHSCLILNPDVYKNVYSHKYLFIYRDTLNYRILHVHWLHTIYKNISFIFLLLTAIYGILGEKLIYFLTKLIFYIKLLALHKIKLWYLIQNSKDIRYFNGSIYF